MKSCRHLKNSKRYRARSFGCRLSGFPIRWLIALERGKVQDLSLPEFARLSKGLGLDTGGFMKELEKRLNLPMRKDKFESS